MEFAKYVKLRDEKFGSVLFDTLNEKVYVTNDIGKEILSLAGQGLSAEQIARQLAETYQASSAEIAGDVREFIQALQSAGLLNGQEGRQ